MRFPVDLMQEVDLVLKDHPELAYTGRPEFCRAAIREKIEQLKGEGAAS